VLLFNAGVELIRGAFFGKAADKTGPECRFVPKNRQRPQRVHGGAADAHRPGIYKSAERFNAKLI
jgi:hypothetical protein